MGVSKNRGGPPKMDGLESKSLLKWMIWGWKPTIFGNIHIQSALPLLRTSGPRDFFPALLGIKPGQDLGMLGNSENSQRKNTAGIWWKKFNRPPVWTKKLSADENGSAGKNVADWLKSRCGLKHLSDWWKFRIHQLAAFFVVDKHPRNPKTSQEAMQLFPVNKTENMVQPPNDDLKMDVSKNSGTPQIIHFNRVFHYKPSILGYPYFWKHPKSTLLDPRDAKAESKSDGEDPVSGIPVGWCNDTAWTLGKKYKPKTSRATKINENWLQT